MTTKGIFISFEGPDGAGKSTMAKQFVKHLTEAGHKVLLTREPGGIPVAEKIRAILLDTENTDIDPRTEALLFAAARRQHLVDRVLPALVAGYIVVCDRFIDSSLAYQGWARGLGVEEVLNLNLFATEGIFPDITFCLDLSAEEGLARIAENEKREVNRLDLETIAFHEKVREGFQLLAARWPERLHIVDASQPIARVWGAVLKKFRAEASKFQTTTSSEEDVAHCLRLRA
jgi:dTMP kinase